MPSPFHFGVFFKHMIRTISKALALSLAFVGAAQAADSYPRLATYAISSPHNYWDPAYQQKLAKLHFSILSIYPTWGSSQDTDMNTVVKKIKAINPNTKVFVYVLNESLKSPTPTVWNEMSSKIDREKWWLYTSGVGTTRVSATFPGNYLLNTSVYARRDANGKTFSQWFAGWAAAQFATPNPALDGFYTDNVFWAPRRDGDWDLNGSTDSHTNVTVQKDWRVGQMQYLNSLKQAMPGKLQLANVADWGLKEAVLTEYMGQYHGGVIEGMIGKTWSLETTQGWHAVMNQYRKTMAAFAAPKLGMCVQTGTATDYKSMRYGLATCSMDDGYFMYTLADNTYNGVPWFDEFDADLGQAASLPATAPWQAGVYRRDFEKGIVLVNPKGNGARTVTLEGEFQKLKGTQDPGVNNGQVVTTVTLQDRDAIFLKRATSVARPEAPNNFVVNVD
jgi:hypothetical protein